jgi:Transcriptional regulators
MKIEEAIKQRRPFINNYQRAAVNLIFSSNWLNEQHRAFFKNYNLTRKQFNVLRILKGAEKPISTAIIRERLIDKMSDASRVVDRLEKKQLVTKHTCPSDKRLVDIALTKEGDLLLLEIAKKENQLGDVLKNLSEKEVITLSNLLDKLRG